MGNHSADIDATNSKLSLVAEALRAHGSCRFRVSGSSMLPTLWPGELVWIERRPLSEIAPGDIVLYQRDGRFFLHRLESLRIDSTRVLIMIRGDAMPQQDPPVHGDELLGILAGVRRNGDWVRMPRRMPVLLRGMAMIVRRSALFSGLLVSIYSHLSTFVSKREQLTEIS